MRRSKKLMQVLRPREQQVLSLRFGLGGRERLSLSQVGNVLDVSKERVRQIEDRALQKLRASAERQNLGEHLGLGVEIALAACHVRRPQRLEQIVETLGVREDAVEADQPNTRERANNAPVESIAEDEADEENVDDIVEDFDPDDATCEVWSGDDCQMAQIFNDCLRNVGIGCVVKSDVPKVRILVLPESEKRAREVVREIIEQTPPQ